jgi:alpha-tubulin suppressor-like RCC1 family protein
VRFRLPLVLVLLAVGCTERSAVAPRRPPVFATPPQQPSAPPPVEAPPPAPIAAPAPPAGRAVQVAAATAHSCALYEDGRVACWGDNGVGQAGGPPSGDAGSDPHWVPLQERATQIATGHFLSCALDQNGDIWCWGNFFAGTVVSPGGVSGTTALPNRPEYEQVGTPQRVLASVGTASRVTRIALSLQTERACAVRGREVVCWDTARAHAGPPNPNTEFTAANDDTIADLATGAARTCVIVSHKGKRHVECWQSQGKASRARTGIGEPVEVSMGSLHTCVRDVRGAVACWRIEVAPGWWTHAAKPIGGLSGGGARSVSAGGDFACAATLDGKAACFLAEPEGLTEEVVRTAWAAPRTEARLVARVDHAMVLSAGVPRNVFGHGHACAILEDGGIACWGDDDAGQLGDGKRVTDSPAVRVLPPK